MTRFRRGNAPKNGNDDSGNGKSKSDPFTHSDDKPDWPSHGAFSALRLYRERNLDLRKSDHRFLFEWRESLINDLGGPKEVDTFQLAMVDRGVELLIIIPKMAEHVETTGIMKGEELAPCLRSSFLQFVNSFRHTLSAAFEHGGKKPKKAPNLKDYLETAYSENREKGG